MNVSSWQRYWRFNFVGVLGFVLQLSVLTILINVMRLPYLLATAGAVELAVLHNFAWHERYTWCERKAGRFSARAKRLALFHLTNGVISLAGNLALMSLLVGTARWNPMIANACSVVACSVLNFALSDTAVFREMDGQ
jgi:putative flippase GtrA